MYFNEELFGSVRVPLTNLGVLFGLPANTFDAANYLQFGTVNIDAIGVYAQGSYALTDKLKLTAGGRFSHEKRKGVGTFDFLGGVNTDKAKGWNAFTPTVTLNYQANDSTLVYASVTRGFKSGVINVGSRNDVINPEYVWSYEVGLKTTTADRKLQAISPGSTWTILTYRSVSSMPAASSPRLMPPQRAIMVSKPNCAPSRSRD
jgi:iron complex outermembrane receptor protein